MENKTIINTCRQDADTRFFIDEYAKAAGLHVDHVPLTSPGERDVVNALKGYAAAIVGGERYTRGVLSSLRSDLKVLIRFGAGYDNIEAQTAREMGIAVMVASGGNSAAVADHAIMLMLALGRQICLFDREMRQGVWNQPRVSAQLRGKTVGLIGFGRVGRILAEYLSGFRCRLLVYDDYIADNVLIPYGAIRAGLDEAATESDYVSLHAPITPKTRGMIGTEFFEKMKPTAFLINTSRGALVREAELAEALANGVIAGAGLDVFEEEPLREDSPLKKMDNVILSPHVAYNTQDANRLTAKITIDNLAAFLNGHACGDVVN